MWSNYRSLKNIFFIYLKYLYKLFFKNLIVRIENVTIFNKIFDLQ